MLAKWTGVKVKEFAIGFGPKVIFWTSNETEYSLRIFPLGGFVRMTGDGDDPDEAKEPGSFQVQPVKSRFAIIAAGPLMNFTLAIILFALIHFAFIGVFVFPVQIDQVTENGRAYEVGFKSGDIIHTINDEPIESWGQVVNKINENPNNEISIEIERDNQIKTINVVPEKEPQSGKGIIGVGPKTKKYQILPSMRLGVENTVMFISLIYNALIQMITGQIPADIAGPVGIVNIVGEVAQTGIVNLLSLAAILNVNLGLMNLLPIPALDGSRLIFLIIESIRGRPVDPNKENFVHFLGFTILILLMIIVTYRDILRLDIF